MTTTHGQVRDVRTDLDQFFDLRRLKSNSILKKHLRDIFIYNIILVLLINHASKIKIISVYKRIHGARSIT